MCGVVEISFDESSGSAEARWILVDGPAAVEVEEDDDMEVDEETSRIRVDRGLERRLFITLD